MTSELNQTETTTPVPSITLQITKQDADRFLEASSAMRDILRTTQSWSGDGDVKGTAEGGGAESRTLPLHELVYEAAQKCNHPLMLSFLDRVRSASLPLKEIQVAAMLFHDSDKTAKLRCFFSLLAADPDSSTLDRSAVASLFRSILVSISCCVHTPEHNRNIVVEGQPETSPQGPPTKKRKSEDETDTTKSNTDDDYHPEFCAGQSQSFDSSLATLRDEDDTESLRREIDEIASYAADEVIKFAANKDGTEDSVSFGTFGEWYNQNGSGIVPWLELLSVAKWQPRATGVPSTASVAKVKSEESPGSLATENVSSQNSRTMISFDFSGSGSPTPLLINITEENLRALREILERTGLMNRSASDLCKVLRQMSRRGGGKTRVVSRDDFELGFATLIPAAAYEQLSQQEKDFFKEALQSVFHLFENASLSTTSDEVDLASISAGLSFFCAGSKSTKLAVGFELFDDERVGYLSEDQLVRYINSYLTVLVAVSFMTPITPGRNRSRSNEQLKGVRSAVENGACWTVGHFLGSQQSSSANEGYSFESFALWYSQGGYSIAPWLELLDLSKVLSLLPQPESEQPPPPVNEFSTTDRKPLPRDRVSSLRRHHAGRRGPQPEILFTFPLANRRSLVVLKEDAAYVRDVVEQLGLLHVNPEDLWDLLTRAVEKRRKKAFSESEITVYVDINTFVQCMQDICPKLTRKRAAPGSSLSTSEELISNFFQCFDINQTDRVALDELMGGLMLLCGGKKSTKLAFAFSIFDTRPGMSQARGAFFTPSRRPINSLSGEDLFLFLRSILIVTFSCCRQSLDMPDEIVGRTIADTANMICNDVMRYQWERKQLDRLDFDEFGGWYNDGGYERAPWLELLDLRKWVLLESNIVPDKKTTTSAKSGKVVPPPPPVQEEPAIPPPPPEDALDTSFFDENAIMPMDSMDDMDIILMQPSTDKEFDSPSLKLSKSFSFSPSRKPAQPSAQALKFHLVSKEPHGGYMFTISTSRIAHLRELLEASGIYQLNAETVSNKIRAKSSRSLISKSSFLAVVRDLMPVKRAKKMDYSVEKTLMNLFEDVFSAFDRDDNGKADAVQLACGMTVLCAGKKSDKLEFAFEILDKSKRGPVSKAEMANYLQSFMTVILSIAFSTSLAGDSDDTVSTVKGGPCEQSNATITLAVEGGAEWAASLAFSQRVGRTSASAKMSFDDFADWYTKMGYSSIPWLELLDLRKWVFTPDTAAS